MADKQSIADYGLSPVPQNSSGSISDYGLDPGPAAPITEPVIDLESGESNVRFRDRVKGGTFFPTDSRQNEIYLQNAGYETMRGPNGELLAKRSSEEPFRPVQESLLNDYYLPNMGEIGTRLASGGGELVKMAAMGIGGGGGVALGTAAGGPLGATSLGAMGAGAGYAAGGEAMSELGARVLGVPENEDLGQENTDMAADFLLGVGGDLGGKAIQKAAPAVASAADKATFGMGTKLTNFLRDKLDKVQAVEKLNQIFGVDNKLLGRGVVEAAEAGQKAPAATAMNLENPITKVYEELTPTFQKAIARAAADGDDELVALGKVLGEEVGDAGKLVGDSVTKLSQKNAGKAISLSNLEQFAQDTTEKMIEGAGKVGSQAAEMRSAIKSEVKQFVESFSTKAASEVEELTAKKMMLLPKAADPAVAGEIQKLEASILLAKAQQADPKVPFEELWNFKRLIQDKGRQAYQGKGTPPQYAETFANFGGATADYLEQMALQIDPVIGAKYANEASRFSLLSDGIKLAEGAIGAAQKQKEAITGLAKELGPGKILKDTVTGISRLLRHPVSTSGRVARVAFEALQPQAPDPSKEFAKAVRVLPTAAEQWAGTMYRGQRFREMAQEVASKPLVRNITGVNVTRSIGNWVSPENAQAAEPDIAALREGVMLSTLIDNGMAPPDALQTGFDINQLPPEQMQQIGMVVQQALQPLQDALKFGGEEEIGAAYSQVLKQFPELAPPPVTGIKGEVEDSQGRIRLFDPTDRARYATQVQVDSSMDWGEKAKVVSELNSTFTVLNPERHTIKNDYPSSRRGSKNTPLYKTNALGSTVRFKGSQNINDPLLDESGTLMRDEE